MSDTWGRRSGKMLVFFIEGTAFVLAGTDGDDGTETAGEGITFFTGTGASNRVMEDTGRANSGVED